MRRKFLKFVIPSVLSMWVFSLYTMVDGIFVAKGAGELALASVNISMPFINAVFSLSILFAVGTSTIAAISLGNNEEGEANRVFTMNMVLIIILGIALSLAVLLNLDKIAYFLGATSTTVVNVKEYLGIISAFAVFAMLSYYFEVLVKTDGHPKLATFGVCISAITNIVLDYIFVIKWGYGVKGAAVATGIAQMSATLIYIFHFVKRSKRIKFVKFKFDGSLLRRTLPIGAADFITELSTGFIIFLFNRTILKYIGETGIITYTIIMYINSLVIMTMAGISQGTQPLVSFYHGRDDKATCSYFLKKAFKTAGIVSLAINIACMIFAEKISGVYIRSHEAEILKYSVRAIRLYAPAFLVLGFNIVFAGFYAAIEKPLYSMIISIGRGFVVITLSMFFMTRLLGENGIWLTSFVSEVICLIIAAIIFAKFYYKDLFEDIMEEDTGIYEGE
jgi:putative MATE family efflux protein